MNILENKIPPPIVMLFFGIIMFGVSKLGYTFVWGSRIQVTIISLMVISGLIVAFAGVYSFKKAETTINPLKPDTTSYLVVSGVYKITRNPMYIGLVMFLIAWGVYLSSWLSFAVIPLFILYMNIFQIIPEERALEQLFGDKFSTYKQSVRRWL